MHCLIHILVASFLELRWSEHSQLKAKDMKQ